MSDRSGLPRWARPALIVVAFLIVAVVVVMTLVGNGGGGTTPIPGHTRPPGVSHTG